MVRPSPANIGMSGKLGLVGVAPPVAGIVDTPPEELPVLYEPPTVGEEPLAVAPFPAGALLPEGPLLYEPSTVGPEGVVPVVAGELEVPTEAPVVDGELEEP